MDKDWKIFTGARGEDGKLVPHDGITRLPPAPPWRDFDGPPAKGRRLDAKAGAKQPLSFSTRTRGLTFRADQDVVKMVNAALYLRRPLLVTGKPGAGKSSLIHAVAHELRLGDVLEWPINSRSALQQGQYEYDAVGRLREVQLNTEDSIEKYLKLGPLGTAFIPSEQPRALLIDEIDKSDLDLPNDLLNIFEQGEFTIPELKRLGGVREIEDHTGKWAFKIAGGHVRCRAFPFVIMTSNDEREFPMPFRRRCLSLKMPDPSKEMLLDIVRAHLKETLSADAEARVGKFHERVIKEEKVTTDQLLNAVFLLKGLGNADAAEREALIAEILKSLDV
ncbi:MAG: MoxR family ATPase [Blastocatellia bacterium]|nr:MoxR family ATPase [Blastocatellia bacterium]